MRILKLAAAPKMDHQGGMMHEEIQRLLAEGKAIRERRDQFCRERGTTPPGGRWADGTPANREP